ncbi:MAG TPA: hypothetical protein VFU05_13890 [Cyclobacteriaceae bacterium]|nr:hypothetical protein [Cyclobacteriaceae bacterium]
MAKKPVKSVVKKSVASPAAKKASPSKPKAPKILAIEKVNEDALNKLRDLNIEQGLQAEIQWCLGSYRADKNPIGLYTMAERALDVFKGVREKNPKAVATKLVSNIEKALKSR